MKKVGNPWKRTFRMAKTGAALQDKGRIVVEINICLHYDIKVEPCPGLRRVPAFCLSV